MRVLPSTSIVTNAEDVILGKHNEGNECEYDEYKKKYETKTLLKIEDQKPQTVNTDESENSSEERGSTRKERKPLPLIFDGIHHKDNNDSSSEASDTKETESCKCVYLGERETLKSFWDKCLYQCFTSKRCVAGERPKRKYRKKLKIKKPPTKKRKQIDPPFSCIDLKGTAEKHKG